MDRILSAGARRPGTIWKNPECAKYSGPDNHFDTPKVNLAVRP